MASRPSHRRTATCLLGLLVLAVSGCTTFRSKPTADYRTVQANPNRDTARAELLHAKALKNLVHCDACYECECANQALCNPCLAEKQLQDALIADVRYGPAHNTLGTLYLRQHKLYLAAWEFEYAEGLMPDRPEPLNNLGLVYEEAGRLGRAIEHYEQAYEIDPTGAEYIGNLARASLKQGTPLDEVRYLLRELRLHDDRPDWIAWAEDLMGTDPEPRGWTYGPETVVGVEEGPLLQPEEIQPEELPSPEPALAAPEAF